MLAHWINQSGLEFPPETWQKSPSESGLSDPDKFYFLCAQKMLRLQILKMTPSKPAEPINQDQKTVLSPAPSRPADTKWLGPIPGRGGAGGVCTGVETAKVIKHPAPFPIMRVSRFCAISPPPPKRAAAAPPTSSPSEEKVRKPICALRPVHF